MNTYYNHRQEPYLTYVQQGRKTIEGRLRKEKYADIQAGDIIHVQNMAETTDTPVRVLRVSQYDTFRDMLTLEEIEKVLPGTNTVDEGIAIYREFYSTEDEQKYGVVAIEFERISIP